MVKVLVVPVQWWSYLFPAVARDDRLCRAALALRVGRVAPAGLVLAAEASGGPRLPPQPLFLRRLRVAAGEYRHQRIRQCLHEVGQGAIHM